MILSVKHTYKNKTGRVSVVAVVVTPLGLVVCAAAITHSLLRLYEEEEKKRLWGWFMAFFGRDLCYWTEGGESFGVFSPVCQVYDARRAAASYLLLLFILSSSRKGGGRCGGG